MAGWHHQCDGHELGQTLGDDEEQWSLVCCSPQGCRVGHDWVTEQQRITLKSDNIYSMSVRYLQYPNI